MITGLDHLVVVVPNLAEAERNYRDVGLHVLPGGVHPGFNTRNALVPIQEGSYIELITFETANIGHRWWHAFCMGGGLVDVCLGSTDLESDVGQLTQCGLEFKEPALLQRQRPDGTLVEWRIANPLPNAGFKLPSLIQDVTERELRVGPREKGEISWIAAVKVLHIVGSRLPPPAENGGYIVELANGPSAKYLEMNLGLRIRFIRPTIASRSLSWLETFGPAVLCASMQCSDGSMIDFTDRGGKPHFA